MGDEENVEPAYVVTFVDPAAVAEKDVEGLRNDWIRRAGKARVEYANGDTFVGDFNAGGAKHGQGTYAWKVGEGMEFVAPMLEENPDLDLASLTMSYTGSYVMGWKQGQGKMTYPNGESYTGNFARNNKHGAGTYTYKNGDMYSGEWRKGKRHGNGAYVMKKMQCQYVGEWADGAYVRGKWLMADGTVYSGSFTGAGPGGNGAFTFPNGGVENGAFNAAEGEEGTAYQWSGTGGTASAVSASSESRNLGAGPPTVPPEASVKSLRISHISDDGAITLTNASEDGGVQNAKGLWIEHRPEGWKPENEGQPALAWQIVADTEIEAGQSLRVLTGASTAGPAPLPGADVLAELYSKPAYAIWTSKGVYCGANAAGKDIVRGAIAVVWKDIDGNNVDLCTKQADGTHKHKFMEEPPPPAAAAEEPAAE